MIEVEQLRFTYRKAIQPAVHDLSFKVRRGEIFGFLGPSGAGKSTTQRILIGLLRDYGGRARVLDKESSSWAPADYERIGVSFETPNHFLRLTGLENLHYFSRLYSNTARSPMALLEMVGLQDAGDKLVAEYSRGMKVRLSFARSLLCSPALLFLDEPTSGLDPANARRITDLIRAERATGTTVFLTTHDMVLAEDICDRLAFMVDGQIARIDSPRALKAEHGVRSLRVEYATAAGVAHADFALDGIGHDAAFIQLLREQAVLTIHTREANLADVFIRVTGRGLA